MSTGLSICAVTPPRILNIRLTCFPIYHSYFNPALIRQPLALTANKRILTTSFHPGSTRRPRPNTHSKVGLPYISSSHSAAVSRHHSLHLLIRIRDWPRFSIRLRFSSPAIPCSANKLPRIGPVVKLYEVTVVCFGDMMDGLCCSGGKKDGCPA